MIKTTTPLEEVRAMNDAARQRGLKVLSVYGDFSVTGSLEAGIRGLKQLVDDAAICECPHLMLGGTSDEKIFQLYYQTIAECCDYAAAKGVGLSIKPHGGQNATGPQCRKAIELVGKKNFGLWYDPGNVFYYSDGKLDPVADAATVDGLVVGMSVKDFQSAQGSAGEHRGGQGGFPGRLRALKERRIYPRAADCRVPRPRPSGKREGRSKEGAAVPGGFDGAAGGLNTADSRNRVEDDNHARRLPVRCQRTRRPSPCVRALPAGRAATAELRERPRWHYQTRRRSPGRPRTAPTFGVRKHSCRQLRLMALDVNRRCRS